MPLCSKKKYKYIWWKAVIFDFTVTLAHRDSDWKKNPWVKRIREEFFDDWLAYKSSRNPRCSCFKSSHSDQ